MATKRKRSDFVLDSPFGFGASLPSQVKSNLQTEVIDWAIARGLVVRHEIADQSVPIVTHAPLSLLPTPFPREAFEHAKRLQPLFNFLVHKISLDNEFLDEICQSIATVDTFTASLYDIFCQVRTQGISQPITLGIHRSDYLLHASDRDAVPIIQQVELNTIAASFSSLSYLTGQLHRHLMKSWVLNHPDFLPNLPENVSDQSLANGLAEAFRLYNKPEAVVMMIVQPGEKNAFDQRWIEYQLLSNHNIKLIRRTLTDLSQHAVLDDTSRILTVDNLEIGVTYFRAGYTPVDYPTDKEWQTRLQIELSRSIKCPSIAYHLAGMKKVQQILALPGKVERFLTTSDAQEIRSCFTGLYTLGSDGDGEGNVQMALARPDDFVLKPQREGGGNNFYNHQVKEKLQQLSPNERAAYILMDRIRPPTTHGHVMRRGTVDEYPVVSELGIYGVFIGNGDQVVLNCEAGHLLRTKGSTVDEGGVAAGYAHIDSPLLI